MFNPIILDAHCDTIKKAMRTNEELLNNTLHVDLQRMKKYNNFIQFFAAFIHPNYCSNNAYTRCINIINNFISQMEKNKEHITFAKSHQDITTALSQGKAVSILTIENGAALEGDIAKLDEFYKLGVRSICLTWNGLNQIACGVNSDNIDGGLTPFGVEVVKRMNALGMLVDVSHITETGYWDVISTSTAPIISSHSNSKAICSHRRNLTDEQFKALIKNGGVTGINLCPPFLNNSGTADMNDILKHIEHFMGLGGEDNIGLGADLDGISSLPSGMRGVEDLGSILEALLNKNYSEEQVRKIAGLNFLRLLENAM